MPLYSGVSKKIISKNISELTSGPAGTTRNKAIRTMMKKGMTYDQAKNRQAVAIAINKAKKSK